MASYYGTELGRDITGTGRSQTPEISTLLDSVRTYQWEITFDLPADVLNSTGGAGSVLKPLTFGAKQIRGIGVNLQDIEVNRMNDKVYYPGRPSYEELEVTFDNLLESKEGALLYEYMRTAYDPIKGVYGTTNVGGGAGNSLVRRHKTSAIITEFNGNHEVSQEIELRGLYPKSYSRGEKNYSNNDFDTIVMKFRYDYLLVK